MLSLALSACEEVPAKTNWMRQARVMGVALLMPRQLACICCSLCVLSQLACIFLPAAVVLARALGHDSAVMHLYSNTLGFQLSGNNLLNPLLFLSSAIESQLLFFFFSGSRVLRGCVSIRPTSQQAVSFYSILQFCSFSLFCPLPV